MRRQLLLTTILAAGSALAANKTTIDPTPADPLVVTMGQRKPLRVRVARNQATLIRLPLDQRVMNVYGGDKGKAAYGPWTRERCPRGSWL